MPFVKLKSKQISSSVMATRLILLSFGHLLAYGLSVGRHRDGLIIFSQHFSTPECEDRLSSGHQGSGRCSILV